MATVIYTDCSYGEVPDNEVDVLIQKGKIIGFRRSGLWMASRAEPEKREACSVTSEWVRKLNIFKS